MLRKIQLYAHTVPTLKFKQIFYRIKYRALPLKAAKLKRQNQDKLVRCHWLFEQPFFMAQSLFADNEVRFLNESGRVECVQDWNNAEKEKLWLYNLHYFDDLNAVDNESRVDLQQALVTTWIEQNPPVQGNGWEPYTLSLRIVNWIKWCQRHHVDHPDILQSLALQCDALTHQLEHHILGNHLFANGKALVFAGAMFKGKLGNDYMSLGLRVLDDEVAEQFLDDGGHFELSPMYHCILLWDMLDLYNLAQQSGHKALAERKASWRRVIEKGLLWLRAMCHPDGEISFFNDAAFGISAAPSVLFEYAKLLEIECDQAWVNPSLATDTMRAVTLSESGYTRLESPDAVILFDHAEVGPGYLPGHAHADTLSIEVSLDGHRVFVNSGTSIYGNGPERHRQRGTPAHNTLSLSLAAQDEGQPSLQDSSEVWGGFRVARRARVFDYTLQKQDEGSGQTIHVKASHDGFKRFVAGLVHERQCSLNHNALEITDRLYRSSQTGKAESQNLPKGVSGVVRYHVAPGVEVGDVVAVESSDGSAGCMVTLRLPNQRTLEFVATGTIEVQPSTWHPEFGASVDNTLLKVYVSHNSLECKLQF